MHTIFRLLSGILLTSQCLSAADSVTLSNGDILEGDIKSIDQKNTLTFRHPASPDLIEIDSTKLKKLLFNIDDRTKPSKASSMLNFVNGDSMMADITSVDEKSISFNTLSTGKHTIARDQVTNIRFGNAILHGIYHLGNTKKPFHDNKGWRYQEKKGLPTLTADKAATMWQEFNLPKDFILKFTLNWDAGTTPELRLHMAAANKQMLMTNARYEIMLKRGSFALSHYRNGKRDGIGSGHTQLFNNNSKNEVVVEVRVSRTNRKITLYLNGVKVRQTNSSKKIAVIPPSGKFIGIQKSSSSNSLSIKELSIQSWDGIDSPDRVSAIPATAQDVIEIDNGNRYSGKLNSISKDDTGALKGHFSSPLFTSGSATFPLKNISALRFKTKAFKADNLKPSHLRSGSVIKLSDVTLTDGIIHGKHPILGDLSIKKSAFSSLKIN